MASSGGAAPLPSNPNDNDGPRILGATLAITSLALITYVARMYVRLFVVHNVGLDDYFMTLAVALVLSGEGVVWGSVVHGAGRHIGDIPPADLSTGLKLNFVSQPMYLFAICIVKLAVGSMLLRIATTPFYRRLIISIMSFMAVYTIACFFTIILQCTDIRALWDSSVTPHCWPQSTLQGLSYTNVSLNILTDLCFAVFIPGPMLWNLNVNLRTRISLLFSLGLGCFACAAAFIKIHSLVNYGKQGDFLWDSRDITIWTVVECNTGIVAANLPTLRPIFRRILGSTLGYGSRTNGVSGGVGSGYHRQKDGGGGGGGGSRAMSSTRRATASKPATDESSSERAFNAGGDYELADRKPHHGQSTVVFADPDALSSDETVDRAPVAGRAGNRTTTTTKTGGPGRARNN
ncbi:2b2a6eeb-e6b9-4f40-a6f9-8a0492472a76 [Thermothielavioides terrestris]|uniref:2b2a6eeb-e6b9-4f40-a6f9-8a0492472a76 n=1 Tax=Thermothielavioides terrestris TaxID=2587410 RepID=A0A3S4AVT9_9PEZI|nr:2b2a6eeb-e6b9-4f40-a6f9-8a0492472a76 [Thermothielavioides terrestris]